MPSAAAYSIMTLVPSTISVLAWPEPTIASSRLFLKSLRVNLSSTEREKGVPSHDSWTDLQTNHAQRRGRCARTAFPGGHAPSTGVHGSDECLEVGVSQSVGGPLHPQRRGNAVLAPCSDRSKLQLHALTSAFAAAPRRHLANQRHDLGQRQAEWRWGRRPRPRHGIVLDRRSGA